MRRALILVLVLAVSSSGCSLALVTRPPSDSSANTFPDCHTSPVAPSVDLLFALLSLAVAVDDDELGVGGTAAVFAISSAVGFWWTSRCAKLRKKWRGPEHEPPPPRVKRPHRRPEPPEGAKGGRCYPNATCKSGFYCDPELRRCRPGNVGLEGGACFADGSCNALVELCCVAGVCVQPLPRDCETDDHCLYEKACEDGYCLGPNEAATGGARTTTGARCPACDPETTQCEEAAP